MTDYDIARLLAYSGPSLRRADPPENGVRLLDYRNTEANERNIATLLSSQGIPFHIERPTWGWTGTRIRLILTVPEEHRRQVEDILAAGAKASAVEIVEGSEGLLAR